MQKKLIIGGILGLLCLFGHFTDAHSRTQIKSAADQSLQPTRLPEAIWVADFEIDADDVEPKEGLLGGGGPLRRRALVGGGPLSRKSDPGVEASKLKSSLSAALVEELLNSSLPARRLPPDASSPPKGWLIRGQFLEADEGNRLRRATIGFGSGATHMQIEGEVVDMENHPDSPFLLLGSDAGSGRMPGGLITRNPYVIAAKIVLSKNASERDVKSTAAKIASEIVKYLKQCGLLPSGPK